MALNDDDLTVLRLIADGYTQVAIARTMGVSFQAINNRLYRLKKRVDAKTLEHLVAIAMRRGWIA